MHKKLLEENSDGQTGVLPTCKSLPSKYDVPPCAHARTHFLAKTSAKNGEMELSAGLASLRAEHAKLLLRMEEGELQKDVFVREVREL